MMFTAPFSFRAAELRALTDETLMQRVGDMLELPAGTVKGRMRLGLVKLRLSLGGDLTRAVSSAGAA